MNKYCCVIMAFMSLHNLLTTGTPVMNIWVTLIILLLNKGESTTFPQEELLFCGLV